jgi:hypothetical protein
VGVKRFQPGATTNGRMINGERIVTSVSEQIYGDEREVALRARRPLTCQASTCDALAVQLFTGRTGSLLGTKLGPQNRKDGNGTRRPEPP